MFRGNRMRRANPRVQIEVSRAAGVPTTIVDLAKERKRRNKEDARGKRDDNIMFEEIWCVFDVDSHPNLQNSIVKARDNGLRLAISNESFELWLLLHFRDNPGMTTRHDLLPMLKQHIPNYEKRINIQDFLNGYHGAVARATKMWRDAMEADEHWKRNPTTNVHELTESIRGTSEL